MLTLIGYHWILVSIRVSDPWRWTKTWMTALPAKVQNMARGLGITVSRHKAPWHDGSQQAL